MLLLWHHQWSVWGGKNWNGSSVVGRKDVMSLDQPFKALHHDESEYYGPVVIPSCGWGFSGSSMMVVALKHASMMAWLREE